MCCCYRGSYPHLIIFVIHVPGLRLRFLRSHVVYCGDGGGDFEGALRVPKGGRILAREGWQLHQRLQKAPSEGRHAMADIVTWVDQSDLGIKLRKVCFPA